MHLIALSVNFLQILDILSNPGIAINVTQGTHTALVGTILQSSFEVGIYKWLAER